MTGRLLLQALVFLLPFIVFGLYLLATRSAEEAGKRKWPIQVLFIIGLALTTILWFALILLEPRDRDVCVQPARYENGVLIPQQTYPCERDPQNVGLQRQRVAPPPAPAPADDPS